MNSFLVMSILKGLNRTIIFLGIISTCFFLVPFAQPPTSAATSYVDISAEEAYDLIENDPSTFIIDVRTQWEYLEGHLIDAHWIYYRKIVEEREKLPENFSQNIIVYCRTDSRSVTASETLVQLGYTQVHNMVGAWLERS